MKQEIKTGAVIVAAGTASRMGGIDKQNSLLGGMPVVVHSILAFQRLAEIAEIVVVTRPEAVSVIRHYQTDYHLTKVCAIVIGGSTRRESVEKGIAALSPETEYYAIHDGARPLASEALIRACLRDAIRIGAATASVQVKDTMKLAAPDGTIQATPDRARLYAAQTPQIFEASLYQKAAALAEKEGLDFTDDCQLIEHAGGTVFLSMGSYRNLKITTPEDLAIAAVLLAEEK